MEITERFKKETGLDAIVIVHATEMRQGAEIEFYNTALIEDYLFPEIESLQLKLQEAEAQNKLLIEGLEFYADPGTYFAISFLVDKPCGDFLDDFSETRELGKKPGKIAREILNSASKFTGGMKTDAFGHPHEHPLHLNESKTHYICNECGFKIMAKRFRKPTGG